jgi:hypothetical protein
MHLRTSLITALVLLAAPLAAQTDDPRAFDGVWIYVEDRTEGRAIEDHQPSMSARITLRVEEDALVLVRSDGEVRVALDGSITETASEGSIARCRGAWKDGAFEFDVEYVRAADNVRTMVIRRVLRILDGGLLFGSALNPPDGFVSVAFYRHPQDIALPAPAKAAIGDLAWLAGAWVGTRGADGATSIEERWSPPLGGAMLGTSRTVRGGAMRAFEFLRVVERDGGLVYVAQPGGRPPTEFVLTELGVARAVFENPRHDHPQRIVYELSAEGRLVASIGYSKGGRPQRFEFQRETE